MFGPILAQLPEFEIIEVLKLPLVTLHRTDAEPGLQSLIGRNRPALQCFFKAARVGNSSRFGLPGAKRRRGNRGVKKPGTRRWRSRRRWFVEQGSRAVAFHNGIHETGRRPSARIP